jgi:uncharacterized membrane protein
MSATPSNQDAAWGFYSVVTVSFEDDDNAYTGLARLKELDSRGQVGIDEAAVVVRAADGRVAVKDRFVSAPLPNTIGGGFLGLLVGIIGGPLGMLIGATAGVFIGALADVEDADQTDSALAAISSSARFGRTTLLAVVREQNREVVDAAMSELAGTVLRRPVHDVEAEIAAVEEAERTAKREARKEFLLEQRDHDEQAAHAKAEKLKSKLKPGEKSSRADHANGVTTSHPSDRQAAGMKTDDRTSS